MIEINPQEVMILTEQLLQGGWIKGRERGHGTIDFDGSRDSSAAGVCVVGALRESLTTVLKPQLEEMLQKLPEYIALPEPVRRQYLYNLTTGQVHGLLAIFRERIEKTLDGRGIESWNDSTERQKQDIIEAMRASLEIITQECLAEWSPAAAAEQQSEADAVPALRISVPRLG